MLVPADGGTAELSRWRRLSPAVRAPSPRGRAICFSLSRRERVAVKDRGATSARARPRGPRPWVCGLVVLSAAFAGHPVGNLTRDEVLDNVTFYWLTNTGVSSARLYRENTVGFFDVKGVSIPAAVSTFAHEIYQVPRSWAEQAYPKLIYFNALDRGNHFAAWQEPALFSSEVRAAFRSLR